MSEATEQAALFEWAAWAAGQVPELHLLIAIPNGEHRHKAVAGRLRAQGVKAGVPDIFLPVARHGAHGLWIELKTAEGRVRPAQRLWIEALIQQGYDAHVVRGWEAAARLLCRYLGVDALAYGVSGEHAADAVGVALAAVRRVQVTR